MVGLKRMNRFVFELDKRGPCPRLVPVPGHVIEFRGCLLPPCRVFHGQISRAESPFSTAAQSNIMATRTRGVRRISKNVLWPWKIAAKRSAQITAMTLHLVDISRCMRRRCC